MLGWQRFFPLIRDGMVVRTVDGVRLGKVRSFDSETFLVERSVFSVELPVRYQDVMDVRDDEVIVGVAADELAAR